MNKYVSRTTLTADVIGLDPLLVVEPIGLEEAPLTLLRSKEFSSVFEGFDSPLTFYHLAVPYIRAAKANGIDTKLEILIEVSSDFGVTWETFFQGMLDLPGQNTIRIPDDYKIILKPILDDVWTRFYERREQEVDISSTTDLDGNAVAPVSVLDVALSPQIVRKVMRVEMFVTTDTDFVDQIMAFTPTETIGILDLPKNILDEIDDTSNYPIDVLSTANFFYGPKIEPKETGDYDVTFQIVLAVGPGYNTKVPGSLGLQLTSTVSNGTHPAPIVATKTDFGTNGVDGRSVYTLTHTFSAVQIGNGLLLTYAIPTPAGSTDVYIVPNNIYAQQSYIQIVGHTTFQASSTKAARLYDVADAIVKRTSGGDNFVSDLFGPTGCAYNFVNMRGLHLRGYDFTQKPFSSSFMSWFKSADAIWNIGLSFEKVLGVNKIKIEEKAHFYDTSANSLNLSYVKNIIEDYKQESIVGPLDIGYSKWQKSSGGSLIDDPQSQHTYAPPSKYVGTKLSILCDWIAASLLFELTRRAVIKLSETFDLDNDTFVLHINDDDEAKLDYVASSNLLDPIGRYNKEITPARNFLRWLKNFNVGMGPQYVGKFFKFVNGLGNFLTSITITPTDCAGSDVATVVENADIEITADVLHGIERIKFEGFDLNWEQYKTIRDNKNKPIGISKTGVDHVPYFIDQIDFYLFKRKANFTLFRVI